MVINNLIETHCHILPGIDDGAKDVETSLKMVAALQAQGAQKINATSHYYSDSVPLEKFVSKRREAYDKLRLALPYGSPEIVLGAEVYISPYLMNNEDLTPACIQGTRYLLLEHPFGDDFDEKTINRVERLIYDYNITPILAHIERYRALMESKKKLDTLREIGCLTQVNISSFDKSSILIKHRLFKYLESERIDLIGSDCHSMGQRNPSYEAGAKAITDKCGTRALRRLIANANELFE
jgi:protein-tyrosine phosphatase